MSVANILAEPAIAAPWPLRDRVAFAGVGATRYGNSPGTGSYGLGCEALNAALDDAGLRPGDVDGLIVNRIPSYERFAEMMGIDPQFCLLTEAPGARLALAGSDELGRFLDREVETWGEVVRENGTQAD